MDEKVHPDERPLHSITDGLVHTLGVNGRRRDLVRLVREALFALPELFTETIVIVRLCAENLGTFELTEKL